MVGIERRLARLFSQSDGRAVIVPVDDSLISGPVLGLETIRSKLTAIMDCQVDAVLAFPGQIERCAEILIPHRSGWIANLTASTTQRAHTRKFLAGTIDRAIATGADAVAAHVNFSSKYDTEMLQNLAMLVDKARGFGVPVLAIVYPRREMDDGRDDNYLALKASDPERYSDLVSHGVRTCVDLGADIIKTCYSGSVDTFRKVISAADGVPVVVAGGPLTDVQSVHTMAFSVIRAGGSGVSFGRNVFGRQPVTPMLKSLRAIVHEEATVEAAMTIYQRCQDASRE